MRPQHDAAENYAIGGTIATTRAASMRPQHDAAENAGGTLNFLSVLNRFNEAAA